jgi:signal transduction histidine kinase
VAVTTIRSESGAVEGYLAIATDVTDRLEVKRRLRESLAREQASVAELEKVNRLKNEFVSAVSHELRTPLTTILGTTQLMEAGLTGPLSPQQEQAVERLHRNGRRLLMLVEDLLTLTSAESRATSREDELSAGSVLAEAGRQTCDLLTGRDLEVVVRDEAPDAVLRGDADELERALVNLVANAIKFTPDGGRVEVASRTEGAELVWRVSDTGMGIPEEEVGHLFERFFRASAAVTAAIPGTGLGLSIVRTIAEAHGGTANRVPHDGPGTTFELRLPLASPTPTSVEVSPVEVST